MGTRNGFHKHIKSVKKQQPATLPDNSTVLVDVSVLMHSNNYKHPSSAAAIAIAKPADQSIPKLVKDYADAIVSHSSNSNFPNVVYVFEGEATDKAVSEQRKRKKAPKLNDSYRDAFLSPKSNTQRAAALKKLASCLGRPPLWFVELVIVEMKNRGLEVRAIAIINYRS